MMRVFANARHGIRWFALLALLLGVAICCALPSSASAEETEQKTVRVGWFDSSFCYWDQFGRRCGLDYEYQRKISAYTGWNYEYVEDSWPNLLQMLKDGKIDLLSDVSYKPERADEMLYPDLPMGTESYYIYIDARNRDISADKLESFDGARIGVNEGSVQEGFLADWAERNNVKIKIVPLTVDEDESMEMVLNGELDGYASIYSFSSEQKVVPSCRIGSSDYYYAVNKERPDLLAELNMALAGIQDEDPFFSEKITEKRLYNTRTDAYLAPNQEDWIAEHGAIRVGYREDLLPFCGKDDAGELTGALKDYLVHATNNLRSSSIHFETIPFPSTQEALDAMKDGKVDCVFPVYLSAYDSDQAGILMTNPAMTTEMNAVMRDSGNRDLSQDSAISFAVVAGDLNAETFIMDCYPASTRKSYASAQQCLDAVASGDADSTLVSNYRIPYAEQTIKQLNLFSAPTGEAMPLSFAVNSSDRELYFLLNKVALMTSSEDMASSLASYMRSDQKMSVMQFLQDNWAAILAILVVVFAIIVILLLQKLQAEKRAIEQQNMVEEGLRRELRQKEQLQSAMDMAYRDPLTGVKSKHAYNDAQARMDERIANGEVSEFSIVVFDLNDLKAINDSQGHDVGDQYIKDACKLICTCFKHSPVFRIGGDEFVAILEGEDYASQDELLERFEKQVLVNLNRDRTVVAFGSSRFNPKKDANTRIVFERADSMMYQEKTLLKSLGSESGAEKPARKRPNSAFDDMTFISVRKHILIADDIEINREILGDLLQNDYDIIYASDGVEAMELLHAHKDEIALVILDLYMPRMSGREVMVQMQVDEDLMFIPVIFISIDLEAELDCLKIGAVDFIPKPYPNIEIIKARISKCIELSENRDLIRRTQRDKLTGLLNIDYFMRYVNRYDQHYLGEPFDSVAICLDHFYEVIERYGRQFADLVLRSVGIGVARLARKTGGIACREEGDTFLVYCPHQDNYDSLIQSFLDDLFVEEETWSKVKLRVGVFADAQREPDVEERFVRAQSTADALERGMKAAIGYYDYDESQPRAN